MLAARTVVRLNLAPIKALRHILSSPPVAQVGIFGNATVAEYARYNELGTSTIPRRSFMVSTMRMFHKAYAAALANDLSIALASGKPSLASRSILVWAERYRRDVFRRIMSGEIRPQNAASTVRRKGFNHPLVQTGEMAASLTVRTP